MCKKKYLVTPTRDTQIWAEISHSVDGSLMSRFILHYLTVESIICLLSLSSPAQETPIKNSDKYCVVQIKTQSVTIVSPIELRPLAKLAL